MLNKSQLLQLSKWAKSGRVYVGFAVPTQDLPEWTKMEFRVARELVRLALIGERTEAAAAAKTAAKDVSRETILSVLSKIQAKPAVSKKSYRLGAARGWATRKRRAEAA